jgi:MinD superfamily P-loop ATPase
VQAVTLKECRGGEWFVSDTRFGTLVHACLGVAQENSGKLVTIVRAEARKMANESGSRYILIDGPPGIGCPVIASIAGTDLAIVVTEPTLSGIHDLERILGLTRHFGIRTGVIVNKCDLNGEVCSQIVEFLRLNGIPLLGKIRFDTSVNRAIAAGEAVVEFSNGRVAREIRLAADRTMTLLKDGSEKGATSKSREC